MTKKSNKSRLWFLGAVILWLGSYFFIRFILKLQNGDAGTFGDQFGAINALFTGLSFAGIIITLRLQQEELSAQRREFMTSRAITVVYKQIELVERSISQIEFLENNPMRQWDNTQSDNLYQGVVAIKKKRRSISENNVARAINEFVILITPLLILTSNSTNLLRKIKSNENMTDEDALITFQSFRFNLDSELWLSFEYLNSLYKNDTSSSSEDLRRCLFDIETFNNELVELENKII